MKNPNWSEEETKQALLLYCLLPFGKMHSRNPEIITLANRLERTPSSVAMKLVNFASLDPDLKSRGIKGLKNASRMDRKVWGEFTGQWNNAVSKNLQQLSLSDELFQKQPLITEGSATVKTRKVQSFFRRAVLSSYDSTCCVCRLRHPSLLNASHIMPWRKDIANRANPSNGLSLCALHDKAFDQGLMTLDDNYKVMISRNLLPDKNGVICKQYFEDFVGKEILLPEKFLPRKEFLRYHRENIFLPD